MRRISIFRDGNMMGAMIGPEPVLGVCGFGEFVPEALRDLADKIKVYGYMLDGDGVAIEVKHHRLESSIGKTPSDAIRELADLIANRNYEERDYPRPDWSVIAKEAAVGQ